MYNTFINGYLEVYYDNKTDEKFFYGVFIIKPLSTMLNSLLNCLQLIGEQSATNWGLFE